MTDETVITIPATVEVAQAIPTVVPTPTPIIDPSELSPRQIEVLKGIASGMTRKEIAMSMKDAKDPTKTLSMKTVEYHAAQLMNKLGIYSVALLTQYAIATKLIDLQFNAMLTREVKKVETIKVSHFHSRTSTSRAGQRRALEKYAEVFGV
jgi:DNA-binding CsgD family transcriptional regulator